MVDYMSNRTIKVCENENFWAAMLYISSIVIIFPLSNIIIPLVLWMRKAKESDFIEFHGKNVLNFQITMLFLVIISMLTWVIFFGVVLFFGVMNFDLIMMLKGAYGAYTGSQKTIKYSYKFIK